MSKREKILVGHLSTIEQLVYYSILLSGFILPIVTLIRESSSKTINRYTVYSNRPNLKLLLDFKKSFFKSKSIDIFGLNINRVVDFDFSLLKFLCEFICDFILRIRPMFHG